MKRTEETAHKAHAERRELGVKLAVVGAACAWAAALLGWKEQFEPIAQVNRTLLAAATLWFLLNVALWMAPSWRLSATARRGPLLGFGFACAAALLSALVDGIARGPASGAGLFFWRFALLAAPFGMPFRIGRRPQPHPLDALVLAYALLLPHLPGFDALWWRMPGAGRILGMSAGGLGPGHLAGAALLATYFYGVRPWSGAPLDGLLRRGDLARSAAGAAAAVAAAALCAAASGTGALLHPPDGLGGYLAWLVAGAGYAAFVEELAVRGLLLPGAPRWLRWKESKGRRALLVAAGALVHAALGSYGLSPPAAFGLSLAIGAVNQKAPRLLPAYLAHAIALAALGAARLWT